MMTITYTVPGMHCASCPKLIAMALEELQAVSAVDARLEDKIVAVMFDEAVLDDAAIRSAIRRAGYEAEPPAAESAPPLA